MAECSNTSDQLSASRVTGSDAIADLVCDLCSVGGLYVEVEGFCVDCGDYLCQKCIKGHTRDRMSKDHVLQDKSQIPQEKPIVSSESSEDKCTEQCEHHSGKIVEYYCQDHGSLGCSVCITMTHRQCINVDHIPDMAPDLLNSQIYKQFQENSSSLKMKHEEMNNVAKANISTAEKSCSDVITAVKELRVKINREYDRMEEEICSQAESIKSNDVKKLIALYEKGTNTITEIEKLKSDCHCLKSSNQLCQLFTEIIKAQNKLGNLYDTTDDIAHKYSVRSYSFVQKPDMEHIINGAGSFGHIHFQNLAENASIGQNKPSIGNTHLLDEPNTTSFIFVSSPNESLGQLSAQVEIAESSKAPASDPMDMTAVHKKDMYVKTASDSWLECIIGRSIVITENRLVLADMRHWKIKLLRVDLGEVVSELSLNSKPYAMTTANKEEVAVTLPDEKIIIFVKVTNMLLKRYRAIPAGGECLGIVCLDGTLITSFCNPARIEIISLEGVLQSTITSQLKYPAKLAVSPDCKIIYALDSEENTVKGITLDGTVKYIYNDKKLKKLGGIAVDKFGQVIVFDEQLKELHLLSPDCRKIKVLVDKLSWIRSVSYCHISDALYIGFEGNSIKMFHIFRR